MMESHKIIAVGCDHAGFPYKAAVIEVLTGEGLQVEDFARIPQIRLIIPILPTP